MTRAIDDLTSSVPILVEHRVAAQSPLTPGYTRRRSSLSSGPAFVLDADLDANQINFWKPTARLILRDDRGRVKSFPATAHISGTTSAFLARYDELVERAAMEIPHPSINWLSPTVGYAPAKRGWIRIDLARRWPVRIFSRDWRSGGRWYCVFWEEMPKDLRRTLWIDGEPNFEYDFSACHLRLAYYAAGAADALAAFGTGDLYALPGFDAQWRSAIKRGANIMLNANSIIDARWALARELDVGSQEEQLEIADTIIAAIKIAHPKLAMFWHSGCGLGLQYVDSEIARISLEKLMLRGVLALPVHDSMLVAERHRDMLVEVMDSTFAIEGKRIALDHFVSLRHDAKKSGLGVRGLTSGEGAGTVDAKTVYANGGGQLLSGHLRNRQSAIQLGRELLDFRLDGSMLPLTTGTPELAEIRPSSCQVGNEWHSREAKVKRARRMKDGKLPIIIHVKHLAPWLYTSESRTGWYARTTEIQRQVLALQEIVRKGDPVALEVAAKSIAKAKHSRHLAGTSGRLAVDDLLAGLENVIASVQALQPSAADSSCRHEGSRVENIAHADEL